jgi:proline iminopeptidase
LILYPDIEPYKIDSLAVSNLHTLYYEESGNPNGYPAVFLHGGPGSGSAPRWRRYFDPKKHRIILFDQRGCGRSMPYASLQDNTTDQLVADIEKLRLHLNIDRWLVVGGSWGSTLALAYAQAHPKPINALILYGLFLGTKDEINWFYQNGVDAILPDAFEDYRQLIPSAQRNDLVGAYYRLLNSDDAKTQMQAAQKWSKLEAAGLNLIPDPSLIKQFTEPQKALAQARIECHYFINKCFLEKEQLVRNLSAIEHIPCTIVHGRYDLICPFKTAWTFCQRWSKAELIVVPDAGHSATEIGIQKALVQATDKYAASL